MSNPPLRRVARVSRQLSRAWQPGLRRAGIGGNRVTGATIDVRGQDETAAWWFLDALVVEHRVAAQMSGVVLEMTLPVGHSPALHVHETLDDSWFAIDGRMAARCGDEEFVIEAGDWVSMPRGVPHTFHVVSDQPARILMVHDNGSFRDFVRHLGAPAAARTVPDVPRIPAMDELAKAAARHDIAAIGPPMSAVEAEEIVARVAHGARQERPPT
jgi:mannose-6-phosphate isomerase-like protein (cupin superfamily)